ncbi:rhomboid family intramembrane serine protease [Staphylococcus hyicus]|uniref:rhomboid family intramembrane serine protease n=1 Tax=Staphylococcus hyicus TaxID=1284 RepID=UPI001431EF7C|nr:rhomboid family intramembrane serine protease [Staphylococcus hyicus]NJI00424.1 rhomboid family intramembrane serine protease [Staphylococcus hyicus]NJI31620.1 rhomboid family intramembrane serine protease [Staphylococcus hyicus]
MIDEKFQWKATFLWIKYYNYKCVHYDKEKNEIWLANHKKQHVVIFKFGEFTSQELSFTHERLKEHKEDIDAFLSFNVRNYDVYVFNDKNIDVQHFTEHHPIKIKFHHFDSRKAFIKNIKHPLLKRELSQKDTKTSTYFKQRTLNQNPVEHAMYQFAPITYSLIAINVLIWLIILFFVPHKTDLEVINIGALSHFNFVHGEIYRLISSIFLHLNFEHLLFNMLTLFIFGKIVESLVGSWRMGVIYFFSGILGNLFTLAFLNDNISLGASGAIFGLLGSIVAIMLISKQFTQKMMLQIIIATVIMAVISLFMSNVNIVAHLGGLLAGALIVYLGHFYQTYKKGFNILVIITAVLIIGLLLRIFLIEDVNIYNKIIQKQMNDGNLSEAKHMIKETVKKDYANDETYYLSGFVIAAKDSKAEAIAEWERGLRAFPNSPILNYQMAIANRSLGDNKSAKKFIKKVLDVNPQNKNARNLKKELDD